MQDSWKLLFDGTLDERTVRLYAYDDTANLKVCTTQKGTVTTPTYRDGNQVVVGMTISDGDEIEIDGGNPDDLESKLLACGFSDAEAKDIARHARIPEALGGYPAA